MMTRVLFRYELSMHLCVKKKKKVKGYKGVIVNWRDCMEYGATPGLLPFKVSISVCKVPRLGCQACSSKLQHVNKPGDGCGRKVLQ